MTTNSKKVERLTPQQHVEVAEWLHLQTASAIMAARQWGKDELAFQGGTALHLCHSSPRYSEDLDFMVCSEVEVERMMRVAERRVSEAAAVKYGAGVQIELKVGKPGNDPWGFDIKLKLPEVMKKVVLKCEFLQINRDYLANYETRLQQPKAVYTTTVAPVMLPTAVVPEIYLDKVQALAERKRIKARDLFDLWWMQNNGLARMGDEELMERLAHHINIYTKYEGSAHSVEQLAVMLNERAEEIAGLQPEDIRDALEMFLPEEIRALTADHVIKQMIESTCNEMRHVAHVIEQSTTYDNGMSPGA